MCCKSKFADSAVLDYVAAQSLREPDILRRLREETEKLPDADMQSSPEQVQFFQLLIQLMGARKALEVGVFTGYTTLAIALTLPEDGRIVACDVSRENVSIGERYWTEAGVRDKIDLRIASALTSLQALLDEGERETFDFAYIDADKSNYPGYYEKCLALVRVGGLLVLDNVLQGGRVLDPAVQDAGPKTLRDLNQKLHADERVTLSMLPVADGITLALKR